MNNSNKIKNLVEKFSDKVNEGKTLFEFEQGHVKVTLETGPLGCVLTVRAVDLDIEPEKNDRYDPAALQECLNKLHDLPLEFNIIDYPEEVLLWANVSSSSEFTWDNKLGLMYKAATYLYLCYASQYAPDFAVQQIKKL